MPPRSVPLSECLRKTCGCPEGCCEYEAERECRASIGRIIAQAKARLSLSPQTPPHTEGE